MLDWRSQRSQWQRSATVAATREPRVLADVVTRSNGNQSPPSAPLVAGAPSDANCVSGTTRNALRFELLQPIRDELET